MGCATTFSKRTFLKTEERPLHVFRAEVATWVQPYVLQGDVLSLKICNHICFIPIGTDILSQSTKSCSRVSVEDKEENCFSLDTVLQTQNP